MTTAPSRLARGHRRAIQPAALLAGDTAVAAWLWFALIRFLHPGQPVWPTVLVPALTLGVFSVLVRIGEGPTRGIGWLLGRTALLAGITATAGVVAALLGSERLPLAQWVWWSVGASLLTLLLRMAVGLTCAGDAHRPSEVARLILLGVVGTLAVAPFYWAGSIGAGDAYWYSIMLADVVAQLREGVFPVWVGQSEYAFNGTVYPLRLAPAFQYGGAVLDALTAGALAPPALKNAVLVLSALLGGFSAYFCLRPILPHRPTYAALLAGIWILSPGVLTPLMRGDMYMTFMTLPFVPMVLHGCWRLWARDDGWARGWIAIGLAGSLYSHAPIALWLLLLAGGHTAFALVWRRSWRRELGLLVVLGALFLGAGAYPALSAATLDNQLKVPSSGSSALHEIKASFPANFRPITPGSGLASYQLGYTLLGLAVLTMVLAPRERRPGAIPLLLSSLAIVPFVLPVPGVTALLWGRLIPTWFITINNVWPMQRLFLIWGAVIVFGAAVAAAVEDRTPRRLAGLTGLLLLIAGGFWSLTQAQRLAGMVAATRADAPTARMLTQPDNVQLTRYAYSSFAAAPTYASHSYMEPWWENRLLQRDTLEPFLSNADAAAPAIDLARGRPDHPRLVRSGQFLAVSLHQTPFHELQPAPTLEPGQRYALRLDFLEPGVGQHLQFKHASLFREYLLPDSGLGFTHPGPPRAFGSLPSSSKVVPLIVQADGPTAPSAIVILPRRETEEFPFARYWLFTYERAELPIVVESWIPYRARLDTAVPAYLETPRLWLQHWRAWRNGQEVTPARSPNNLVMVPVEPGRSEVVLEYRPPFLLRAAFWLNVTVWALLVGGGLAQLLRRGGRRWLTPSFKAG